LYVKPVQTGKDTDLDTMTRLLQNTATATTTDTGTGIDRGIAVGMETDPETGRVRVDIPQHRFRGMCLFSYAMPASPHLSAALEGNAVDDATLLAHTEAVVTDFIAEDPSPEATPFILIEGAGGPLSPAPSGSLQADVYKSAFGGAVKVIQL
jgi:dethiobiotin synthetase/adenosylmethionine--8-amino-7-oxononanoate aminotransferase